MKKFKKPEFSVKEFNEKDILTLSFDPENPVGKVLEGKSDFSGSDFGFYQPED